MKRGFWLAEMDYQNRVINIFRVCKNCLGKWNGKRNPKKPAHPTFFKQISRREADRILRKEMGHGLSPAGNKPCEFCQNENL